MASLLFVCTGNTCRSPMAEALARRAVAERLPGVRVGSAGTFATPGLPAATEARDVVAEHGLDLESHHSQPLTESMAAAAGLVLCMSDSHRRTAVELGAKGRAVLLSTFLPRDHPLRDRSIVDPIGGGREAYEEAYEVLERAVDGLVEWLLAARRETRGAGEEGSEEEGGG